MKNQQQVLQRCFQDVYSEISPYENIRFIFFSSANYTRFKKKKKEIFVAGIPNISNWYFKLIHLSVYTICNCFIVLIFFYSIPVFRENHH